METTEELTRWAEELEAFSARNAGRLVRLEEDHPELGAQVSAAGHPLRGIAFDPRDGSLEIMVGELGTAEGHLTHTVRGVEAVQVSWDAEGRETALRAVHGGGQTVLCLR
jgi:hypothetical protein